MRKRRICIEELQPAWTQQELAENQDFQQNMLAALVLALQECGELEPWQAEQALARLRGEQP